MQTQSFQIFQKRLGSRLQEIRKARGLSQEGVGSIVGMDRVSIGYIEQGKRAPKLSTLYALAETYGVEMRDFFDFDCEDDAGGCPPPKRYLPNGSKTVTPLPVPAKPPRQ